MFLNKGSYTLKLGSRNLRNYSVSSKLSPQTLPFSRGLKRKHLSFLLMQIECGFEPIHRAIGVGALVCRAHFLAIVIVCAQ
jgi:hypothetical protein